VVVLNTKGERVAVPAGGAVEVETNRVVRVAIPRQDAETAKNWVDQALKTDAKLSHPA
jgi:hypothetical protein